MMNERIRELVKRTGFTESDLAHGRDEMLAVFAELIIQECADLMNSDKDSDRHVMWNRALYETRGKIFRHFGVEE